MHLSDIQARLKTIGTLSDNDVPLVETLLLLGAMGLEDNDLAPYHAHLAEMQEALSILTGDRLEALHTVFNQFGYTASEPEEDFNLLTVIDKRTGPSIALGAIAIDLALKQGWPAEGLTFPKHFLFQIQDGPRRLMADPEQLGIPLDAGKLRQILKKVMGPSAELNHDYYIPISMRDIILRFCNIRKITLIGQGDYIRAAQIVTRELWVAPDEPRLYFEAGVLAIKMDAIPQALEYLHEFIERSDDRASIAEAQEMIRALQRKLS